MTRYYLIKEVDGIVVRKTEITHAEPRDAKGRYRSPNPDAPITVPQARKAKHVRCPQCGYRFLVA